MVKDTEEEEGKELRNRFLEVQLRPPITEASHVSEDPDDELMKTSSVRIEDYTGFVAMYDDTNQILHE